jgi:hypothetical protein
MISLVISCRISSIEKFAGAGLLLSVRPAALPYIYFRVFSLEPSYQ